jgi:hypothetical protein
MKTVQRILTCALLAAAAMLVFEAALLLRAATVVVAALPHEIGLTRAALTGEIAATRNALASQLEAARRDVLQRSERQAQGLRRDLAAATGNLTATADRRAGDALATLESLRQDWRPALQNASAAERSATALLDAYSALPAQFSRRMAPSWDKLEPEITCRLASGAGYGGCWHARVTAVLGEAANAGGVFTRTFPSFAGSATGIASDVHLFTSKAVAPRGFWGTFKDLITTGSGVTRALGAAGLFDEQVTIPRQ